MRSPLPLLGDVSSVSRSRLFGACEERSRTDLYSQYSDLMHMDLTFLSWDLEAVTSVAMCLGLGRCQWNITSPFSLTFYFLGIG